MTDDTGIVAFLNARLDDEERYADSMAQSLEIQSRGGGGYSSAPGNSVTIMTMWLPDRVRREVAAKRQRLAEYLDAKETLAAALKKAPPEDDPATAHSYVRERINANQASGRFVALEGSIRLDAAVYNDHPDYEELWKL